MSNIPVKTSSGGLSPVQLSSRSYNTGMEEALNRLGEGVKSIGRAVERYGEKQKDVADYKEYSSAAIKYDEGINNIRTEFSADPTKDIGAYSKRIDEMITEHSKTIKDNDTRLKYIYKAKSYQMNLIADFGAIKAKADIKTAKENYITGMSLFGSDYHSTADFTERQTKSMMKLQEVESAYKAGLISAERYQADKKFISEELPIETAEIDVNTKPVEAVLADIEAGKYGIPKQRKGEAISKVVEFDKQLKKVKEFNLLKNQTSQQEQLLPEINSITDPIVAKEMKTRVASLALNNQVSSKFASSATKYLNSISNTEKSTNKQEYGRFVDAMYQINADFENSKNESKYLKDVQEFKQRMLDVAGDGKLTQSDIDKLNKEFLTISKKPKAEAISEYMDSREVYSDAKSMIESSLPIELRAEATADFFDNTYGKKLTKEQTQEIASKIVSNTQKGVRTKAVNMVKDTKVDAELSKNINALLDSLGAE